MKKILFILFFSFIAHLSYGQTFTQTFIDRCTGDIQIVTANFVQGSAVVAFYDEVKLFTYQEFLNGQLQQWLIQKYLWWQALSPCSQAQQQAQQAQQAAQSAANAASSAAQTTGGTNGTNTQTTSQSTQTDGGDSTNETNDGGVSNESGDSEGDGDGSGDSSSEENEDSESESDDGEEDSESSDEDSEEEEDEEEEKRTMMPIQLKADFLGQQSLTGTYNMVLSIGASQSSIFGDVSYTAGLLIWDNLSQAGLSFGRTKITLNDSYEVKWIDGISTSYMRSYGVNAVSLSLNRMKPIDNKGTIGLGVNYSNIFGKDALGDRIPSMYSLGWTFLYTNLFQITDRILYTPALIAAQNPLTVISPFKGDSVSVSKDFMAILANSFTVQLTRRFSFNVGWTIIYSTNEFVPLLNSFMIGSKLPF